MSDGAEQPPERARHAHPPGQDLRPAHQPHGQAVQIEPMKSKLKAPGTTRLKLKCDILLSTSAFKIKLRRYSMAMMGNGMQFTSTEFAQFATVR